MPHYVSQPPNPKATLALLHAVEEVLDVPVPLAELPQQADEWQKLVDEMAAEDDEVTEYIRNLEERDDEIDRSRAARRRPGDAIAREFERYLRRRDRGGGHAGRHVTALTTTVAHGRAGPPPRRCGNPTSPWRARRAFPRCAR